MPTHQGERPVMNESELKIFRRVMAALIGAESAYREYASRDPFKRTRLKDWKTIIGLGREILKRYPYKH
jgi:hypothetical protein